MIKMIQTLIEAINMIPRQFYADANEEEASKLVLEKFVSQFIVRYRKIAGDYCGTELVLPSSEAVQSFAVDPDRKNMLRRLTTGLSSFDEVNPTLIMEPSQQVDSLPQKILVELNTEFKLNRPLFYWNFFKLHFLLDKMVYSHGFYCIIHQDVCSIQKKVNAYYERGLYASWKAENIFFLVKKDYKSDVVVLNYKGALLSH